MESLAKKGKTKAIGVSYFTIKRLESLLQQVNTVPAENQVEAHPYLQQPKLLEYCHSKGIRVQAYSALGNNQTGEPRNVDDPLVHEVAKELQMDPGVVLGS